MSDDTPVQIERGTLIDVPDPATVTTPSGQITVVGGRYVATEPGLLYAPDGVYEVV